MTSSAQPTMKINSTPLLNAPLSLNKVTFVIHKKKDRLNKVYNSDGEPGPFYDMENLEVVEYLDVVI